MAVIEGGGKKPKPKPKAGPKPKPKPKPAKNSVGGRPANPPSGARVDAVKSTQPKKKQKPPARPRGHADDRRQSTMKEYPVSPGGGGLNVAAILDTGMSWLGVPYKWGGTDPRYGLDCSGLIQAMFAAHGVKLPRVSYEQARAGVAVRPQDARPGDIIAMDWNPNRPGIDHVGVYLGNGKMLVAPRSGKTVEVQAIDFRRVATVRRVLPEQAFASIRQPDGKFVYTRGAGARPQSVSGPGTAGPDAGGGDPGNNPKAQGVRPQDVVTTESLVGSGGSKPVGMGTGPDGAMTADDFGFAASFFNSDPELKALLDKAIKGDWSGEKFQVEFQKTNWYKNHSPAAREWIALNHNDPAGAKRKLEITVDNVKRVALEMGADVTDDEARALAVQSLTLGLSPNELQKRVGLHVSHREEGDFRGEAGVNYVALKQKAAVYGVPVSDLDLSRWVRELAAQNKTEQDFDNWVKAQAKLLFPGLAREIDTGLTPQEVANLYVNTMAQIWEIDPLSVDWSKDPMIKKALSSAPAGGAGPKSTFKGSGPGAVAGEKPGEQKAAAGSVPSTMPLWEFERLLKQDPRWLATKQADQEFMGIAGMVLRDWGLKF